LPSEDLCYRLELLKLLASDETPQAVKEELLRYAKKKYLPRGSDAEEVVAKLQKNLVADLQKTYLTGKSPAQGRQRERALRAMWDEALPRKSLLVTAPPPRTYVLKAQEALARALARGVSSQEYQWVVDPYLRRGVPADLLTRQVVQEAVAIRLGKELAAAEGTENRLRVLREAMQYAFSKYDLLRLTETRLPTETEALVLIDSSKSRKDIERACVVVAPVIERPEVRKRAISRFTSDAHADVLDEIAYLMLSEAGTWRSAFIVRALDAQGPQQRQAVLKCINIWGSDAVLEFGEALLNVYLAPAHSDVELRLSRTFAASLAVGGKVPKGFRQRLARAAANRLLTAERNDIKLAALDLLELCRWEAGIMSAALFAELDAEDSERIRLRICRILGLVGTHDAGLMQLAMATIEDRKLRDAILGALSPGLKVPKEVLEIARAERTKVKDGAARASLERFLTLQQDIGKSVSGQRYGLAESLRRSCRHVVSELDSREALRQRDLRAIEKELLSIQKMAQARRAGAGTEQKRLLDSIVKDCTAALAKCRLELKDTQRD